MATPVMVTKVRPPSPRPGLVARERLLQRLGDAPLARLTLVSAPAGFGKTTLVAQWLRDGVGLDGQVAWLSLDRSDDEPGRFWWGVLAALGTVVPGIAATGALFGAPQTPVEEALAMLVNDLAAAGTEVWLVLDDYHVVTSRAIVEAMTLLLEHLPPNLHLVITTRADPDLPLGRWRARGELVEIRAAQLQFTPDEAAGYLAGTGLTLDPADVRVLSDRTEGWAAALQLVAISLRGRQEPARFVARFGGDDRDVVDYLTEEVLTYQPEHVRDFLLHTCVLDRLCADLCDAVTGRDDGARLLGVVERANLFLVPVDDQRRWFRYHQLFAAVLRARLAGQAPQLVPLLHRRASAWFAAEGKLDEAVVHALAGQDEEGAVHLIELAVPEIRRNRREAALGRWLAALPDRVILRHPVLTAFSAYLLMSDGQVQAASSRLDEAERTLERGPGAAERPWADTLELRTLPASIQVYRAALALAGGDLTGTRAHARAALDLSGPDDHLSRGSALGFRAMADWSIGNIAGAMESFGRAMTCLRASGNLVDELSSTVVLADLTLALGRPSHARELYRQALAVADAAGDIVARAAADLHVGMGELDYDIGDLTEARRHLEAAAVLAERTPVGETRYRWFVALSRLVHADGDHPEAHALLEEAERLYPPGFFPEVRPIPALRARLWIAEGRLDLAADWAHRSGVSPGDEPRYLAEYEHLTLARLLLARCRRRTGGTASTDAAGLLARLKTAAQADGRIASLVEIGVLQALVADAGGDRKGALHHLDAALALRSDQYLPVRLILDEGRPAVDLVRADPTGIPGDTVRSRLARLTHPVGEVGGHAWRASGSGLTVDRLSERELEVLRLLDTDLTGPQLARHLFISYNTLRTHTKRVFTKLGVTSRRAAVHRAHTLGLLPPPSPPRDPPAGHIIG